MGKSISTELGGNLSPRGLVLGLASIGGGVSHERGANRSCGGSELLGGSTAYWQL